MPRRYRDYNPTSEFLGNLGTGLSSILGGYLGAKVEQDKTRRQQQDNERILKARYPNMPGQQLKEYSLTDQRFLPHLMSSLDQQKQREQEGRSIGTLAERMGVDRGQLQGMDPREQRSFLGTQQRQQQAGQFAQALPGFDLPEDSQLETGEIARLYETQQRRQREQDKQFEIMKQQLVEKGYSPEQVDKE
jgi:hypothetical protein